MPYTQRRSGVKMSNLTKIITVKKAEKLDEKLHLEGEFQLSQ